MRRRILLLVGVLSVLSPTVRAQITVQVAAERDTLLLYEAIRVNVTVRNYSGRTIDLGGPDNSHWLGFLIADEAGERIPLVGQAPASEPATIPPGRTEVRTVDLLPYYDLRQRGTFTVRAVVDGPGIRTLSPPVKFTVLNGRQIWKQTVGLPVSSDQTNDEYRTYSLLTLRVGRSDFLYVGAQDEPHNLVYGTIPLGECLAVGEPSAKIDSEGNLHVLYRSGPRSYSYAEIDPAGKTLKRTVHSDLLSVPHLATGDDGAIAVAGGEQTYPRVERVMTEAETNPQPPAPAKPPKKKWWWPFGPARTNATSSATTTNSPTTNWSPRQ